MRNWRKTYDVGGRGKGGLLFSLRRDTGQRGFRWTDQVTFIIFYSQEVRHHSRATAALWDPGGCFRFTDHTDTHTQTHTRCDTYLLISPLACYALVLLTCLNTLSAVISVLYLPLKTRSSPAPQGSGREAEKMALDLFFYPANIKFKYIYYISILSFFLHIYIFFLDRKSTRLNSSHL